MAKNRSKIDDYIYKGEGLPEIPNEDAHRFARYDVSIPLDIRFLVDQHGTAVLQIAPKDAGWYFSIPIGSGLTPKRVTNVSAKRFVDAIGRLDYLLIAIFQLARACYFSKDRIIQGKTDKNGNSIGLNIDYHFDEDQPNQKAANHTFDQIMNSFDTTFKQFLKPGRFKANGFETKLDDISSELIIKGDPISTGRNPKAKQQLELEKEPFIKRVFKAFTETKTDKMKISQDAVAMRMFPEKATQDAALSSMRRLFKKYDLDWKHLKAEYEKSSEN